MITAAVNCRWCMDRMRVQLDAHRSHPCIVCDPQPWQQALIPPAFKFKRPWKRLHSGRRAPL